MENLTNYIHKHLNKDNYFLAEGIYVDDTRKIVTLNDTTKGVDFNGPIEYPAKDITVISMFKRTPYDKTDENSKDVDGNSFIYALKEKDGWKIEISNEEIHKYCRKFISNCEKLHRTFDTIVMIPTTSKINERFMKVISKYVKSNANIKDLFDKRSLNDDLKDIIYYDKIAKLNNAKRVKQKVERYIKDQKENECEYFEAKLFKKEYLKYIKSLTTTGKDYSEELYDKDVLILDDTYSTGETISRAVDAIRANYNPKSITAITLLSKKFKK